MKALIMSLVSLAMVIPYVFFIYAFQGFHPEVFIPPVATILVLLPVMLLSLKGARHGMLSGLVFSASALMYSLPASLAQPQGYGLSLVWGFPVNMASGGLGARGLRGQPKWKFVCFFAGAVSVQFISGFGLGWVMSFA